MYDIKVLAFTGDYEPISGEIIDRLDGRVLVEWPDGARVWYNEETLQKAAGIVSFSTIELKQKPGALKNFLKLLKRMVIGHE